jgi:tetratricopeptide (TPR) repeat protein
VRNITIQVNLTLLSTILLLAFSLTTNFDQSASAKNNIDSLKDDADNLMQSENYQKAIELYDKVLAKDPKDMTVLNGKGLALYNLEKYEEAITWYDKTLAIDPKLNWVLYNKAIALEGLQRYQEAIEFYDKALAINPDDPDLLNNKRLALEALNNITSSEPSSNESKVGAEQDTTLRENTSSGPENLTSFLTYENETYGIKVRYPPDWTIENAQSNASDDVVPIVYISPPISMDPNANAFLEIGYDGSVQSKNFKLEQYLRDTVETYKAANDTSNFKVVTAKTDTTLAGNPGYSLISTDTEDSIDMKSIEVGTFVNNKLYYLLFKSEESKFNTFLPEVQKMIDSFEIANGEQVKQVKKEVNVDNNVSDANSNLTVSNTENTGPRQVANTNENLSAGSSEPASQEFTTTMSGAEEVPPVDTDASAEATFIPLEDVIKYVINVTGISETTAAHIHLGDKGENGFVLVDLLEAGEHKQTENGMILTGNITDSSLTGPLKGMTTEELTKLLNGGEIEFVAGGEGGVFKHTYVNIHTEDHQDGEIRGQIS